MEETFRNLTQFRKVLKNEKTCREYLAYKLWGEDWRKETTSKCPKSKCNGSRVYMIENGKRFKCRKCEHKFSITNGTIFWKSKLSLKKWFEALYLYTSRKNGVSPNELCKEVKINRHTEAFIRRRLEKLLYPLEKGYKMYYFPGDDLDYNHSTQMVQKNHKYKILWGTFRELISFVISKEALKIRNYSNTLPIAESSVFEYIEPK
jgi:transposase-like protein